MLFEQTWRWFGPKDPVTLMDAKQAGATGIVTALHQIPNGQVWTKEEIVKIKNEVEKAGMVWSVIESIPIHETIKTGSPERDGYIKNYIESLHNVASFGLKTVCYNFMPVLDWTRTDLDFIVEDGSKALRFDFIDFAAFEIFVYKRKDITSVYSDEEIRKATTRWKEMSDSKKELLSKNILMGLPGTVDDLTIEEFRAMVEPYHKIGRDKLKENYAYFLKKIIPEAEALGIEMTVHPDDPPFSIFGLPRIVSNEDDLKWLTSVVDSPSNGICFCTGSLGAGKFNDLPGMAKRLANKINFIHLRSVQREDDGSFFEANHLEGSSDMFAVVHELLKEQKRRGSDRIPFRPDHGHLMLDDAQKPSYPGYSAVGRMRGLAELRGLITGIERMGI